MARRSAGRCDADRYRAWRYRDAIVGYRLHPDRSHRRSRHLRLRSVRPGSEPGACSRRFFSRSRSSVDGSRFIVDPGVPTYSAGALRDETRSAASHNGPHVKGHEPIEFWGAFRVGRRGSAGAYGDDRLGILAPLWCAGWHTGYMRLGTRIRRYVGLWPGQGLLICDLWLGAERADEAIHFLIPTSWHWMSGSPQRFARAGKTVAVAALCGHIEDIRSARHWLRYGVAAPAHLIAIRPERHGEMRRAATWFSWGDEAAQPSLDAVTDVASCLAMC